MRNLLVQLVLLAIETLTFVHRPSIITAIGFGFVAALTLVAAALALRDNLKAGARS
jgi:hypothetical protein